MMPIAKVSQGGSSPGAVFLSQGEETQQARLRKVSRMFGKSYLVMLRKAAVAAATFQPGDPISFLCKIVWRRFFGYPFALLLVDSVDFTLRLDKKQKYSKYLVKIPNTFHWTPFAPCSWKFVLINSNYSILAHFLVHEACNYSSLLIHSMHFLIFCVSTSEMNIQYIISKQCKKFFSQHSGVLGRFPVSVPSVI